MSNYLNKLNWDSDFFGFDVYLSYANSKKEITIDINKTWLSGGQLLYLMSSIELDKNFLNENNGLFVGTKVIFKKEIKKSNKEIKKNNIEENISEFSYNNIPEELLNLAYQSGVDSRFRIDHRLPNLTFEKMYYQWLKKAIDNNSVTTLIYKYEKKLLGFISIEIKGDRAQIGLFAVDNSHRGKGIGQKLLKSAESYVANNEIYTLYIPTQKENEKACSFYYKHGYIINNEYKIYHFIKQ